MGDVAARPPRVPLPLPPASPVSVIAGEGAATPGDQLLVDEHKALANALDARKAAAKLRVAGAKLTEEAEHDISRDRMTNSAKRARQASQAMGDATRKVELGRTMGKLADALEEGTVPHLVRVSTRAAVEELESALRQAMYAAERAAGRNWGHRSVPEVNDIVFATVPRLTAWKELVFSITRRLERAAGRCWADACTSAARAAGNGRSAGRPDRRIGASARPSRRWMQLANATTAGSGATLWPCDPAGGA